ncbi:Txe/YoeB family addiction module toxin [Synechococcus sp. PCC 7336]|uniref:Txe/YoeB family addiction module toxin n=1 Tax=Synechococcus sp. PCC 7336 TaxID=195250 RepID=UPI0008FBE949|nr:Txe/YoeB family addiction module toxin [Synechococcus sp. PCC 7336]
MEWRIEFSRNAVKSTPKLRSANLEANVRGLLNILRRNPHEPPYEKLSGNLQEYYSRRINIKHRLVYSVDNETKIIRVVSVWSHYE